MFFYRLSLCRREGRRPRIRRRLRSEVRGGEGRGGRGGVPASKETPGGRSQRLRAGQTGDETEEPHFGDVSSRPSIIPVSDPESPSVAASKAPDRPFKRFPPHSVRSRKNRNDDPAPPQKKNVYPETSRRLAAVSPDRLNYSGRAERERGRNKRLNGDNGCQPGSRRRVVPVDAPAFDSGLTG